MSQVPDSKKVRASLQRMQQYLRTALQDDFGANVFEELLRHLEPVLADLEGRHAGNPTLRRRISALGAQLQASADAGVLAMTDDLDREGKILLPLLHAYVASSQVGGAPKATLLRPPVSYSAARYREDVVKAVLAALGLTLIAAIPLGLLGVANLVDLFRHQPLEVPWMTYFASLLIVPASYFLAAIVAGTAVFLLRPLRGHVLGWMVTGAVLAAIIYGSVALALAAFWNPVGALFLEHSTKAEAWALISSMIAILSPVGAIVGAYMWWRDRQGKPVW